MDYLDKLTQLAQVRGEINIRCLFQGDWQVEHQPDAAEYQGLFHLIEQGECWVTLAGKQFHLKKGDLFFLPQNRPHFLGSSQQKRENSLQREQSMHFSCSSNRGRYARSEDVLWDVLLSKTVIIN